MANSMLQTISKLSSSTYSSKTTNSFRSTTQLPQDTVSASTSLWTWLLSSSRRKCLLLSPFHSLNTWLKESKSTMINQLPVSQAPSIGWKPAKFHQSRIRVNADPAGPSQPLEPTNPLMPFSEAASETSLNNSSSIAQAASETSDATVVTISGPTNTLLKMVLLLNRPIHMSELTRSARPRVEPGKSAARLWSLPTAATLSKLP